MSLFTDKSTKSSWFPQKFEPTWPQLPKLKWEVPQMPASVSKWKDNVGIIAASAKEKYGWIPGFTKLCTKAGYRIYYEQDTWNTYWEAMSYGLSGNEYEDELEKADGETSAAKAQHLRELHPHNKGPNRHVKIHDDFTTLPNNVWKHLAFAYAAYETPIKPKLESDRLFSRLRGFDRMKNEDWYSIFRKGEECIVTFRGTDPSDTRDIKADIEIGNSNEPKARVNALTGEITDFLIKENGSIKVTFTGHSLGGTLASQCYAKLKCEGTLSAITFQGCYSFNPGASPLEEVDSTPWDRCLMQEDQHIIINAGDIVPMGLARMANNVAAENNLKADIHVIKGLKFSKFGSWINFLTEKVCIKMSGKELETDENLTRNKLQIHNLESFFTTKDKPNAITRAEMEHYFNIENRYSNHEENFEILYSQDIRINLVNIVNGEDIFSTYAQQHGDASNLDAWIRIDGKNKMKVRTFREKWEELIDARKTRDVTYYDNDDLQAQLVRWEAHSPLNNPLPASNDGQRRRLLERLVRAEESMSGS